MKFKAKAIMSAEDLKSNRIPNNEGFVTGWLIEDYIVSGIDDLEDGWLLTEWFAKVDLNTIEMEFE